MNVQIGRYRHYKGKERVSVAEKNELLYQQRINFDDLPSWQKWGMGVYWEEYDKSGENPLTGEKVTARRRRLRRDLELPMGDSLRRFCSTVLGPRGKRRIAMATHIQKPTTIEAAGQPPKLIEEFIGPVNSGTTAVSIARMKSPSGWSEPGQTPEFDEYTVVLRGNLHVKLRNAEFDVGAGQAIIVKAGEWVRYSSPSPEGAEYVAVCTPAFSPDTVHRE